MSNMRVAATAGEWMSLPGSWRNTLKSQTMAYARCQPLLTPPSLGILIHPSQAVPTPWWMSIPKGNLATCRKEKNKVHHRNAYVDKVASQEYYPLTKIWKRSSLPQTVQHCIASYFQHLNLVINGTMKYS